MAHDLSTCGEQRLHGSRAVSGRGGSQHSGVEVGDDVIMGRERRSPGALGQGDVVILPGPTLVPGCTVRFVSVSVGLASTRFGRGGGVRRVGWVAAGKVGGCDGGRVGQCDVRRWDGGTAGRGRGEGARGEVWRDGTARAHGMAPRRGAAHLP